MELKIAHELITERYLINYKPSKIAMERHAMFYNRMFEFKNTLSVFRKADFGELKLRQGYNGVPIKIPLMQFYIRPNLVIIASPLDITINSDSVSHGNMAQGFIGHFTGLKHDFAIKPDDVDYHVKRGVNSFIPLETFSSEEKKEISKIINYLSVFYNARKSIPKLPKVAVK